MVLLVVAVVCAGAALLSGGAEAALPPAAVAEAEPAQPLQQPAEYLTRTITCTYDPLHRLTGATYSTGESFAYAYDAVGNVTVMTETVGATVVTRYTYNPANQLLTAHSTRDGITWHYTFDRRGNLIRQTPGGTAPAEGETRYTYDSAGQLVRVELYTAGAYTTLAEAAYNADGERVRLTTWAEGAPLTVTCAVFRGELLVSTTGLTPTLYLRGRGLLAEYTTGWAYPLRDGEGSVHQMADAGGTVILARTYRPFGGILEEQGAYETAFGFLGAQLDRVSGLLYAGGRYYDPATGRYLTPGRDVNPYDPRTLNRYAPVQDPTLWLLAPLGLVAALVGRKRRRGGWWLVGLVLVIGVGVSSLLVACQPPTPTPTPQPPSVPSQPPQQPPQQPPPTQPPEEPPPAQPQEPAPAQSQPSNPVPATPCPEPYLTPKSGYANVRSGPTRVVSNLIGELQGGQRAEVLGQFGREENGIWWWRIRYSDNGQTVEGWVRSDVVTLVGQVQFPRPKAWISPFGPGVGYEVTWGFGDLASDGKPHDGVDLRSSNDPRDRPTDANVPGREVFAMADGVITYLPNTHNIEGDYWMNVLHEHPDGKIYWVQYTHFKYQSSNLLLGAFINQNTLLGYYAKVGTSTGPHLHISIKSTDPTDPDDNYPYLHSQAPLDPALYIP